GPSGIVANIASAVDVRGAPGDGAVSSVAMSAPTGFSVSGSPVTTSGTLALSFASGYSLPTTAKQSNWDTAYGWGNHASAGYAVATSLATVATSGSYNDLTDKPSIPAGTVTSVGMSVPTGLQVSGSPVTSSGTLAESFASGYAIPTTAKQSNWDTAYGWGNHASAGNAPTASPTFTGTVTLPAT